MLWRKHFSVTPVKILPPQVATQIKDIDLHIYESEDISIFLFLFSSDNPSFHLFPIPFKDVNFLCSIASDRLTSCTVLVDCKIKFFITPVGYGEAFNCIRNLVMATIHKSSTSIISPAHCYWRHLNISQPSHCSNGKASLVQSSQSTKQTSSTVSILPHRNQLILFLELYLGFFLVMFLS